MADNEGSKKMEAKFISRDTDNPPSPGSPEGGEKKAGRRKINIEFIDDKSRRHITFSKRKAGIMKKAYELSTLTGTQVLLLVASETGHVYTFATPKLQPLITKPEGKNLIQACLNTPDSNNGTHTSQASHTRPQSFPELTYPEQLNSENDEKDHSKSSSSSSSSSSSHSHVPTFPPVPLDVANLNYNQRLYVAGLQQAQQQQLQQAHLQQASLQQHQSLQHGGLQHPNLPVGYLGRSNQPYPAYPNPPFLQNQQAPSYWQNKPMPGGIANSMPMPFLQNQQSSGQNSKN
eukprot:TRINITY_DN5142_c0_g1_i1.p1 TRINITY_DN5142_c0_g1~~TRINITY_DN5142_c0_g1_i1.p1  ORF type:complete len:289 (-),score=54.57 TRINITY_DN5142_c0_g1_i1:208-1074(-)